MGNTGNGKVRIAVDAMGGDKAPQVVVEGAAQASKEKDLQIFLVGKEDIIKEELKNYEYDASNICIVNATQVIAMDEHPVIACKDKRDASIMVCTRLVKEGKVDGLFSAGNTGAVVVSSLFTLGKLEGVDRPAIAVMFPTLKGFFLLIDGGATIDCKPKNLFQFAIMGSAFMEHVFGYKNPRVGLLSVGEEPTKGNELTIKTYELLKNSSLNFVGNIEGSDMVGNKVDIIVCDGFVGNIVLKFAENLFRTAGILVRREFVRQRIVPSLFKEAFDNFKVIVDYAQQGGMPLIGVNGVCVIGHGKSSAKAIRNAIKVVQREITHDANRHIKEYIKKEEKPA